MKCSYCNETADFKCARKKPFMCPTHFGIKFSKNKSLEFEHLDIKLDEFRLTQFKSKLTERMQKIKSAKTSIFSKTRILISNIEAASKQVGEQLEAKNKIYMEFFNRNKFCKSEMQTIEKIELFDINVKINEFDEIINEVKKTFSGDLITEEKTLQNMENQFLRQHNGGFWCGAITNDFKTLVTGGCDSAIRIWDLDEKKQKSVLFGHNSFIKCIILTGDSRHIISGSLDASVRIWNFSLRSQIAVLRGHKGGIYGISYVENKDLIVSGDREGKLIVWDFINHIIIGQIDLSTAIWSMELVKSRSMILVGVGRNIQLIEVENLKKLKFMEAHSKSVLSLAVTNDEKMIVSGASDSLIIVWDLIESEKICVLTGHIGPVRSLAVTVDNQFLVSGSDDKSVRVWDLTNFKQIYIVKNHTSSIYTILWAEQHFLTISEDSSIGELKIDTSECKLNQLLKPFEYYFVDFTAESKLVGYGSLNKAAIWDLQKEVVINELSGHQFNVQCVEVSRDGRHALSCSLGKEKNLFYWNLESNQIIAELKGHTNSVFCASFSKDGLIAASGSSDKTVRIWDLREAKQDLEFRDHSDKIYSIKFIYNKNLLVSAGGDKKIIVRNLKDSTHYATLNGHTNKIWSVIITDDEKYIISGDFYDGIRIWNVENKRQEFLFRFQDEEALKWLKLNGIKLDSVRRFLKV